MAACRVLLTSDWRWEDPSWGPVRDRLCSWIGLVPTGIARMQRVRPAARCQDARTVSGGRPTQRPTLACLADALNPGARLWARVGRQMRWASRSPGWLDGWMADGCAWASAAARAAQRELTRLPISTFEKGSSEPEQIGPAARCQRGPNSRSQRGPPLFGAGEGQTRQGRRSKGPGTAECHESSMQCTKAFDCDAAGDWLVG